MKMKKLFLVIFAMSALKVSAGAQVNEQAAREKALRAARPHLGYLRPGQFLGIQRDEDLEQKLAAIAGGLAGSEFIYKVSPVGDEIKERSVVHHILTDIDDPVSLVAVNPLDGSTYLIHGFAESKADFNRLMGTLKLKISRPDQAEALADFYREVNPERLPLTPTIGLLDLKQAAERQCQDVPFDPKEKDFGAWWKQALRLYSAASFKQTATHTDSGYAVEWMVLSSPGAGLCGGAALRARLEVGSEGQVGKLSFVPLARP
ncbi:hypothetical protein [Granulicella sp. dw_53]|uniref:hypothetical protein n=1 Tax=Granulicella sp. dw_53 TaxID=2719792 RepID=UPI001BD566ED|nr:hypothetical protein [Granulicella sp. dw_53]